MGAVERLYETLANVEGRAAQGRRELWGGAIANIGAIPGQIAQQQRQQALTLLEQARELRARGEYDLAQKKFAEAERTHQNQKQITAAMFADPDNPDVSAGVRKAIELGDDPAFAYELGQKIAPKIENAAPGSMGRFTTGPQAGQIVPGSEAPERITYTEPKPMMVGGTRQLVRTATQGPKTWTVDLQGNKIDATVEPDQPPKSLQTKSVLLDGQPAEVVFNPATGKFENASGVDVSARVKPLPAQSGIGDLYRDIDPKAIANAIRATTHPPDIAQYGRPAAAAIASELAKPGPNGERPFNLAAAEREWKAQLNLNRTMNGAQQVRLDESIRSGLAMYDRIDALADQWNGKGWGPLSRANLEAARQGLKGPEAQSLANQLTGQIGQLTSDVATIEQGGLTPTSEARAVAEQSMRDWWGKGTIKAMTEQGRANMQIRHLARQTQEPMIPGNAPSTAPAQPATPAPPKVVSLADLAAIAQRRGTTVDQERARAIQNGYAVVK